MANKNLFANSSGSSKRAAVADTVNEAGGRAYSRTSESALAQLAVTGVFNDTFYSTAAEQLASAKALAQKVSPEFLAKLAVYARTKGHMKDLPAYLCAMLASRDVELLAKVFPTVINNGKMLRNFVQIIRSGVAGRKSLGSRPKKLVAKWLEDASDKQLLSASIGASPSLADVIRLSHPKANDPARDAFFKQILGIKSGQTALPALVQELNAFRAKDSNELPAVPFELLTSLDLSVDDWVAIARNATWTQTRMNLNTFARHGVFSGAHGAELTKLIADRIQSAEEIAKAKVFPYQLLAAYMNVSQAVPSRVKNALQTAMDKACENVPSVECDVAVLVDTSGSMGNSITGSREGATSVISCVQVAGLIASAVLRKNPDATIVPFDTAVRSVSLNPHDSIMTNAQKLALRGGGTNCACALEHLNKARATAELVVFVSDNESWAGNGTSMKKTAMMQQWDAYKKRVPHAKLVCIDLVPNQTTQTIDRKDIVNVGGFSDEVFNLLAAFARGQMAKEHWVGEIEKIEL